MPTYQGVRCDAPNQKQPKFWLICSSHSSTGTGSVQAISQVQGGQKLAGLSGFRVMPASAPSLTVCMPVASVLTKCQEEVSRVSAIHPGSFRPKCDKNGDYMPLQCYGSIGYCWCAFPNGTEVPHTRSRGKPNCSGKQSHSAARKELEGAGARVPFTCRDPRPRGSHSALHFSLTFTSNSCFCSSAIISVPRLDHSEPHRLPETPF